MLHINRAVNLAHLQTKQPSAKNFIRFVAALGESFPWRHLVLKTSGCTTKYSSVLAWATCCEAVERYSETFFVQEIFEQNSETVVVVYLLINLLNALNKHTKDENQRVPVVKLGHHARMLEEIRPVSLDALLRLTDEFKRLRKKLLKEKKRKQALEKKITRYY